jgi:hypothetical protein
MERILTAVGYDIKEFINLPLEELKAFFDNKLNLHYGVDGTKYAAN